MSSNNTTRKNRKKKEQEEEQEQEQEEEIKEIELQENDVLLINPIISITDFL